MLVFIVYVPDQFCVSCIVHLVFEFVLLFFFCSFPVVLLVLCTCWG